MDGTQGGYSPGNWVGPMAISAPVRPLPVAFSLALLLPAAGQAAGLPAPAQLAQPIPLNRLAVPRPPSPPATGGQHRNPTSTTTTIAVPDGGELITERYANRAVKIQRAVKQDEQRNYVNHGPWMMWDPQGRVIAQGEYLHGRREGQWFRTLASFAGVQGDFQPPFTSQATFEQGRLHGMWTVVDSQNKIVGSWEFKQGVLDGSATIWYPGGQQKQEMAFRDGLPDGESIAWKQDSTIWAREYYRRGKQLVPLVNWYDKEHKESEGWVLRSNIEWSTQVDWWAGTIEVTRNETAGEELRVGKWTEWHINGTVRYSGTFEQGLPVGEHSWWHQNGQRLLSGVYRDGQRDGRWTKWHANGQKQEEGSFLTGAKDGEWIAWSDTGEVIRTEQLAAGSPTVDGPPLESQPVSQISLD